MRPGISRLEPFDPRHPLGALGVRQLEGDSRLVEAAEHLLRHRHRRRDRREILVELERVVEPVLDAAVVEDVAEEQRASRIACRVPRRRAQA